MPKNPSLKAMLADQKTALGPTLNGSQYLRHGSASARRTAPANGKELLEGKTEYSNLYGSRGSGYLATGASTGRKRTNDPDEELMRRPSGSQSARRVQSGGSNGSSRQPELYPIQNRFIEEPAPVKLLSLAPEPTPPTAQKSTPPRPAAALRSVNLSPRGIASGTTTALTDALRQVNDIIKTYENLKVNFSEAETEQLVELGLHVGMVQPEGVPMTPQTPDRLAKSASPPAASTETPEPAAPREQPPAEKVMSMSADSQLGFSTEGDIHSIVPMALVINLLRMNVLDDNFESNLSAVARTYVESCEEISLCLADDSVSTVLVSLSGDCFNVSPEASSSSLENSMRRAMTSQTVQSDCSVLHIPLRFLGVPQGVMQVRMTSTKDAVISAVREPAMRVLIEFAASACANRTETERSRRLQERSEVLLKMASRLTHDSLDETKLINDIAEDMRLLIDADRCAVFFQRSNGALVATIEDGQTIEAPAEGSIVGRSAEMMRSIRVDDVASHSDFFRGADASTGYTTRCVMCAPVLYEGQLVAVAELINKNPRVIGGNEIQRVFTEEDGSILESFGTFIGLCLRNCHANASLTEEKAKVERLFAAMTQVLEQDMTKPSAVIEGIRKSAEMIVDEGYRAVLMQVDPQHGKLTYEEEDGVVRQLDQRGITGSVVHSKATITANSAFDLAKWGFIDEIDSRGIPGTHQVTGMVSLPITYGPDVIAVLNVCSLRRKTRSQTSSPTRMKSVTSRDEVSFGVSVELLERFCQFSAIWLRNATLMDFTVKAGRAATKLSLGNQAMRTRRNTVVGTIDARFITQLMSRELPDGILEQAKSSTFDIFVLKNRPADALEMCARLAFDLLLETGLPQKLRCPPKALAGFIIAMQQRYRKVPYHNFFHAVDVLQTLYTFLFEGKIADLLPPLETFTMLITALAHDVDHMGLNNSFHLKTDSPLGILSSASGSQSVLEVHHCNITIDVLCDPDCNVFAGLNEAEESTAYRLLIDCILATDMAKHKEIVDQVREFQQPFDENNKEHRKLACMVMLKMSDISNVTKPFDVSRQWGQCVVEEFSHQGDEEKKKGMDPLPMFDRQKNTDLSKSQIGFIDFVTKEFFGVVTEQLLPQTRWSFERMMENRETWVTWSPTTPL